MSPRLPIAVVALVAFLAIAPAARADWVWPVSGEVITSYRNGSDPYAAGQHRGVDIAAPLGAAVVAATGGEVRFAGTAGSSGLTVSIRTADGAFDTSYLHLSSLGVRKGDRVATGERIGAVGTTGRRSATAPHLHFGVRDAGTRHAYHDPLAFLPPAPGPARQPRPAPAPAPTPVPVVPAPEPAPEGKPERELPPEVEPTPELKPAPAPRHAPVPEHHRIPLPSAPPPVAALRAGSLLGPAPHGARRAAPAGAPHPAANSAPGHAAVHATPPPAASGPPASQDARPEAASGLDPGYALACVGLLLAAALLGLSQDGRSAGRRATGRGRERLASTLRPLLGRRP